MEVKVKWCCPFFLSWHIIKPWWMITELMKHQACWWTQSLRYWLTTLSVCVCVCFSQWAHENTQLWCENPCRKLASAEWLRSDLLCLPEINLCPLQTYRTPRSGWMKSVLKPKYRLVVLNMFIMDWRLIKILLKSCATAFTLFSFTLFVQ